MMALIEAKRPAVVTDISRNSFGPGTAGAKAWHIISVGAQCSNCGLPARGTTDVDVLGDLEQFPNCSPECDQVLKEQIGPQLEAQGQYPSWGENGWGRA